MKPAIAGMLLAFVAPLSVTVPIDGLDVTVTPVKVRELPQLVQLATPLFDDVALLSDGLFDRLADGDRRAGDLVELAELLGRQGPKVIELVALLSRQPVDWVGDLLVDRAAELLATCIAVNVDFFTRAAPHLFGLVARIQPAAPFEPTAVAVAAQAAIAPVDSTGLTPSTS